MKRNTHKIQTLNGYSIHATFFFPDADIRTALIIAPAMGVNQKFYEKLACWLSDQGYLAVTFDYFGTGLSLIGHLRDVRANILDWAQFDCDAVLVDVQRHAPGKSLFWLGHSLGGQIVGFIPNPQRISKVITIATGSGYWLENSPALKRRVWWLWYIVAPIATRLFGYFPGKKLRKVGNLPRQVMEQWRRWCLHPEYAIGVEGMSARNAFAAISSPMVSISFTDDEMMSARNTQALHDSYTNAPKTMIRISPSEVDTDRIGHFGFFNQRHEKSLWLQWLLPQLKEI